MSRLGRLFRSRITLALLGVALVGGGGAVWAVTTGAHSTPWTSSSLSNQDPTNTTTTDPGATATPTHRAPTATPRATATPCVAIGLHWQGRVVRVSPNTTPSTFVLAVGCARPTIAVDGKTSWPGQAKSVSDMSAGWVAEVEATSQGNGTYLATLVNAQPDN